MEEDVDARGTKVKFFNIFLRLGITRFLFGLCDHIIVSLRSFNITNISKK